MHERASMHNCIKCTYTNITSNKIWENSVIYMVRGKGNVNCFCSLQPIQRFFPWVFGVVCLYIMQGWPFNWMVIYSWVKQCRTKKLQIITHHFPSTSTYRNYYYSLASPSSPITNSMCGDLTGITTKKFPFYTETGTHVPEQ